MTPNVCLPRSAEAYLATLGGLDVEHAERYRARDVTGDHLPETFCNFVVADATEQLGCPVPLLKATQQLAWCARPSGGGAAGWGEVYRLPGKTLLEQLAELVGRGQPVVVFWANEPHGHTALVRRVVNGVVHVTAAGAHNFNDAPLSASFGPARPLRFFTHA